MEIKELARGNQGTVYKVTQDVEPFVYVLKTCENIELAESEVKNIEFISGKVDIKLPQIYSFEVEDGLARISMEFLEGESAGSKKFAKKSKAERQILANNIVENLLKLQTVKNDTYGKIDGEQFKDWHGFYRPFALKMLEFVREEVKKASVPKIIYEVMQTAYENYDKIFDGPVGSPVLTHGDYWINNILANDKMEVTGVVDPFNVTWAEPEYEIFALTAKGDKLNLIKTYKKRAETSKKFDLKCAFYYMFTEMNWFYTTKKNFSNYWVWLAKRLKKQLRKWKI